MLTCKSLFRLLILVNLTACGSSSSHHTEPAPAPVAPITPTPTPTPPPVKDNRALELVSVQGNYADGSILLNFNMPVTDSKSLRLTLDGKAMTAPRTIWSEDKTSVQLVLEKKPFENESIEVILTDFVGANGSRNSFQKTFSFTSDNVPPTLVSSKQIGLEKLVLEFSEPLSLKTNFAYHAGPKPEPVYSNDDKTVTIPFDPSQLSFSYGIFVRPIDRAGNVAEKTSELTVDIRGPVLEGLSWKDDETLQIKLNEQAILKNSLLTIDGQNVKIEAQDQTQLLTVSTRELGLTAADAHRVEITGLQDVYGNTTKLIRSGFSRNDDKTAPMITGVEQLQTTVVNFKQQVNFKVSFSERIIDSVAESSFRPGTVLNETKLSLAASTKLAADHKSLVLSLPATDAAWKHLATNTLALNLEDALGNFAVSQFQFQADVKAGQLKGSDQIKQLDLRTLELTITEPEIVSAELRSFDSSGLLNGYTLSQPEKVGDAWKVTMSYDHVMPDTAIYEIVLKDKFGNFTPQLYSWITVFNTVTEAPQFEVLTFSNAHALLFGFTKAVTLGSPLVLVDADDRILDAAAYEVVWVNKGTVQIFFKTALIKPLNKILVKDAARFENPELKAPLIEIQAGPFLPKVYLGDSKELVDRLSYRFLVDSLYDVKNIKVSQGTLAGWKPWSAYTVTNRPSAHEGFQELIIQANDGLVFGNDPYLSFKVEFGPNGDEEYFDLFR